MMVCVIQADPNAVSHRVSLAHVMLLLRVSQAVPDAGCARYFAMRLSFASFRTALASRARRAQNQALVRTGYFPAIFQWVFPGKFMARAPFGREGEPVIRLPFKKPFRPTSSDTAGQLIYRIYRPLPPSYRKDRDKCAALAWWEFH
jgi:hypothetical protein